MEFIRDGWTTISSAAVWSGGGGWRCWRRQSRLEIDTPDLAERWHYFVWISVLSKDEAAGWKFSWMLEWVIELSRKWRTCGSGILTWCHPSRTIQSLAQWAIPSPYLGKASTWLQFKSKSFASWLCSRLDSRSTSRESKAYLQSTTTTTNEPRTSTSSQAEHTKKQT